MRPAPHFHATVDAAVHAVVVAGWFGLTVLLAEVIFGSSIQLDANSRLVWLAIAAFMIFYPVWTMLAVAMTAQSIGALIDRRHHS